MDYSAGQIPKAPRGYTPKRTAKQIADDARKELGNRCVELLKERGAMTTSQIARELDSNAASVAAALGDVPRVMRDNHKSTKKNANGSYSACALWMMPV
jgi:predicted flap endonuclease-1-like 5' DNA nuclease